MVHGDTHPIVITVRPRRSLSARGLRQCVAASCALIMIPTLACAAAGLWGAIPFGLLEALIFTWALRSNSARGRDYHRIVVTDSSVTITLHERGQDSVAVFARHWTRVRLGPSPLEARREALWIESRGECCEVAPFVLDTERAQLAAELQQLIGRMGESPPLGAFAAAHPAGLMEHAADDC